MPYPKTAKPAGTVMSDYEGEERTLDEVLATFENKPLKQSELHKCWKLSWTVLYPGHYCAGLQATDLKFLRHFGKHHGVHAYRRLATVVANWHTFAERCKEWNGKPAPTKPRIGYLAGNRQAVYDFVEGSGDAEATNPLG